MNYFSTRDKSLKFSFKDVFLRGLAPGGGLFLPSEIKHYDKSELDKLSQLSYEDLATEILFNFCSKDIDKTELKSLIKKSYQGFEEKEVTVIALADKRSDATFAQTLYQESKQSIETRDKNALARKQGILLSPASVTKPDKKQRRKLREFKERI